MRPEDQQTAEGMLFTDQVQLTMAQLKCWMAVHHRFVLLELCFRKAWLAPRLWELRRTLIEAALRQNR